MKVIALVTDINNDWFVNFMKPTCEFNKLDLVVLTRDHYQNHSIKDKVLYSYIKNLDPNQIIMYTDSYDTLFLSGEDEILEKYHKTNKEILFSAEANCYPDHSLAKAYPDTKSPFKYLNSGGFVGKVKSIKEFIDENLTTPSITKFSWSNQIYWTEQFLRNTNKIGLDTACDIFTCLSSTQDIAYLKEKQAGCADFDVFTASKRKWFKKEFHKKEGRLCVTSTGGKPCHVHFNGVSKILLEDVLEIIGY